MTRRLVEIDSLQDLDTHLATSSSLAGWFVRGLDLRPRAAALLARDARGAVLLGCTLDPATEARLRDRGALLFPRLPDLPFDPYRATLYDAAELYGRRPGTRPAYAATPDAAIYAWSQTSSGQALDHALAATLHDHAITDALDDATAGLHPRRLVGVMGGHALRRDDPAYTAAADLGLRLARQGATVLTGGGPGAMEAANLGAYLSPVRDALPEALDLLAAAASFTDDPGAWLDAAFAVRDRWPERDAGRSLSIPTWFYGHEPTNVFATGIAKYFANALREDTLLHRCRGGIVFLPGQAGTVQEIFQAVTENFYAADPTLVAPMVLVGADYWTTTYPAWPLLRALGAGRALGTAVHLVDNVAEAAAVLGPLGDGAVGPPVARGPARPRR
jgi:predicted Rossmann-fold nucleotide-binding protein